MNEDLVDGSSNAREAAFGRLSRIEGEGAYIGLDADDAEIGGRGRRQTLEYVAGITRWRRRLDFLLARYYEGEYDRMELGLKIALRIGLYDVLYLRKPPYAAVHEAVSLAKKKIRRGAGGLVNGVLRSILRDLDRLPQPDSGDDADDLAVEHSHPTWIVRRWMKRYGREDAEALLRWNNTRPVYGVRINTLKIGRSEFVRRLDAAGISWEPIDDLPYFIRMEHLQPLLEQGLLQDGLCAVQDASAGLIVTLLDPQPGDQVVDLCAAPGGKALHSAQQMENRGRIAAVDIHEGRLRLVARGSRTQGVEIVETIAADARTFDGRWSSSDRVLVDAPCSGLGVLSKRADLRWRRTQADLAELTRLQDELLDAAARLVRPGGVLVYGTCTIEPEENEHRVSAFLERRPEFTLVDPRWQVPERLVTLDGYFKTFPPRDLMDGAFGARLRRAG